MQRAAAYIRVSDERQDEFSPDSQLKLIREYCAQNNFELLENLIFYDDGISAKNAERRKEFCRMIETAKSPAHPFDAIIVWKYSRFARNQEESIIYKSLLRRHGVKVISVSEPMSNDPFSSLVERIIEWMDEYYVVRLSSEVKRGMIEKALRGQLNNSPPIGYILKGKRLVIDTQEAEIIKQIFSNFNKGSNTAEVARHLNEQGYRTRNDKPFEGRSVRYILQNPIYVGYIRWSKDGRMASNRHFDSKNFIVVKGEHKPIISDEDFEIAQIRLSRLSKKRQKSAGRS